LRVSRSWYFASLFRRWLPKPLSGAATLNGTLRDVRNGAIRDAQVIVTEKSKGLTRESLSDTSGSFLFPSVSPGIYAVQVRKEASPHIR